jgi:hypothetical protein
VSRILEILKCPNGKIVLVEFSSGVVSWSHRTGEQHISKYSWCGLLLPLLQQMKGALGCIYLFRSCPCFNDVLKALFIRDPVVAGFDRLEQVLCLARRRVNCLCFEYKIETVEIAVNHTSSYDLSY